MGVQIPFWEGALLRGTCTSSLDACNCPLLPAGHARQTNAFAATMSFARLLWALFNNNINNAAVDTCSQSLQLQD